MTGEHRFRRWRRSRPFWGALLIILGGAEILLTVWAPLGVVLHVGMQGMAGYLVPAVLLLAGILLMLSPDQRLFYSILAALLSMVSWVTSNLGGFIVGLLFALIGSALAFAWTPEKRRNPHVSAASAPTAAAESPAPTDADGRMETQEQHASTEDAPG